MFGILKDIVSETVKTIKTVDDAVTDVYKEVKACAEDMGVGPESLRNMIKGKE